jgi:hypothetical protein
LAYHRTQCIKAIHTVFENDKQGGTTRQTVKLIGQFVKSKGFRSRPEVPTMPSFLFLWLLGYYLTTRPVVWVM